MTEEVIERAGEVSEVEIEEWEPTPEYAVELEKSERISDPVYWAQPKMGDRKILLVDATDEEKPIIEFDREPAKIGGDLKDTLIKAGRAFGPFEVAVDVYRDNKAICLAISQALRWKGANLERTIPYVRFAGAVELYGFLANHRGDGRVKLLNITKTQAEKRGFGRCIIHPQQPGIPVSLIGVIALSAGGRPITTGWEID